MRNRKKCIIRIGNNYYTITLAKCYHNEGAKTEWKKSLLEQKSFKTKLVCRQFKLIFHSCFFRTERQNEKKKQPNKVLLFHCAIKGIFIYFEPLENQFVVVVVIANKPFPGVCDVMER